MQRNLTTLAASLALCTASHAQPEYEFVWLETGDLVASRARSLSPDGVIVGQGIDQAGFRRATIWSDNGLTVLPTPVGYDNAALSAMNSQGLAVGAVENADWGSAAAIWDGQAWSVYEPWDGYTSAWLVSVSENGRALGTMYDQNGESGALPIQVMDGQVEALPMLPDWEQARAKTELADGTILGSAIVDGVNGVPVRWVDGVPEQMSPPHDGRMWVGPAGTGGHISMNGDTAEDFGWIWDGQQWTQWQELAEAEARVNGFNSAGDFVAWGYWDLPLLGMDGEVYDLRDLAAFPDGTSRPWMSAISDSGMIVGTVDFEYRPYAMALRPIPGPATAVLLGLGGLFACRRRRVTAATVCLATLSGTAAASGPPKYFVDIVGERIEYQVAYHGLDDAGRVVGMYERLPAVWEDGVMTELPVPFETFQAYAISVSQAGIAGVAISLDGSQEHVVVWRNGEMEHFSPFGGQYLNVTYISPAGHVVGWSHLGDTGGPAHAFRWHDGEVIDLGNLGRDRSSSAWGADASGAVVGSSSTRGQVKRAFLWTEGQMQDLGALPGQAHSRAIAINASGMIVGMSEPYNGGILYPCIWDEDGIHALPVGNGTGWVMDLNDAGTAIAYGLNDAGQKAGVAWLERELFVLEDHLASSEAWRITAAIDINNHGQILSYGTLGGLEYGVILTPACPADFNLDRLVDTRDVVAFLGAWAAGEDGADYDDNGTVDSRDVTAFLSAWASGCG